MDFINLHILSPWTSFFATSTILLLVLLLLVKPKQNADEPPYIQPKVSIIGHIIGIATKYNAYYFSLLSVISMLIHPHSSQKTNATNNKKTKFAIFTIPFPGLPNGKVYIVNSPSLRYAVYKDSSRFSLSQVESVFTQKMAGLSPHATKILGEYVYIGESNPSYLKDGLDNVDNSMLPCRELLDHTKTALASVAKLLGKLQYASVAVLILKRGSRISLQHPRREVFPG
jgi:hypothetical protein